jgi:type IV pilus assembly protein PilQ
MRNKKTMHFSMSLAIGSLAVLSLSACAPKEVQIKPVPQESQEIKDIRVVDLSEKMQIIVEAEQPIVYTTFRLTDPLRLVLDMAGTTVGKYHEPIEVNSGAVTRITPIEGSAPSMVARLEVGLSQAVATQVTTSGTKLVVDIMKPTEEAMKEAMQEALKEESASPVPPETSVPSDAAASTETLAPPLAAAPSESSTAAAEPKAASEVTQVQTNVSNGTVNVTITGDGVLKPEVQELSGNRLVVDLPGTNNKVKPNVIKVNNVLVKQIRIGQHLTPKKVRIVLDLKKKATYTVGQENNQIILALTAQAPSAAEPTPVTAEPKQEASDEIAALIAKSDGPPKPAEPEAVAPLEEKKEILPLPPPARKVETVPAKRYTGRKISLDFQDADITNVVRLIADVSGYNMVVGDDVKGKVTLKLVNVPWDQALEIILKMNNLGQVREGNIIRIGTLANIARQEDEEARAKDAKIKAEELVTQVVYVNYAKAKDLSEPLKKNLSPRGDITIDERTNAMILKDVPRNIGIISGLVKTLDTQTPQVLIEARIVEATTSFARALGIQWGAAATQFTKNGVIGVSGQGFGTGQGGAPVVPPFGAPPPTFAVNLPAGLISAPGLSSFGGLGFTFGKFAGSPFNLDLRISAGESQGLSKIISAPKITALDNQQASIEQGSSIPYVSVSAQGTQTIFVDAILTLQVTPHVTADGSVTMKVKVANNTPDFSIPNPGGPPISKKEANTNILVKDGETAVIGGIVVNTKGDTTQGIPWFHRIPVIGWLFKTNTVTDQTTELLVFLTPRIIK